MGLAEMIEGVLCSHLARVEGCPNAAPPPKSQPFILLGIGEVLFL